LPASQPIADGILATSLIVHSYMGFDQCLIDYVHPRKFPTLGPLAKWALRAVTGLSVWGVYEFNTNDVGEC
jgi:succinate dehydrogenase (ubiquinone) membrane anchor subunit